MKIIIDRLKARFPTKSEKNTSELIKKVAENWDREKSEALKKEAKK